MSITACAWNRPASDTLIVSCLKPPQAATAGSTFAGWSGACTGAGACSVTMSAARSVTATFTLNPVTYTLSVTKAGTGTGTVTSSPTLVVDWGTAAQDSPPAVASLR